MEQMTERKWTVAISILLQLSILIKDFKFFFLFGVLPAVRASMWSLKLQSLQFQYQRDILYQS